MPKNNCPQWVINPGYNWKCMRCKRNSCYIPPRKYWDSEHQQVKAGCWVNFSYGIPPVIVHAKVVLRAGKLIALTPGHNPKEMPVSQLKRHVGYVIIVSAPSLRDAEHALIREYLRRESRKLK